MIKIEIWSDFACPFCYIGKRKLEKALNESGQLKNIEIVWKSYQLNPQLKNAEGHDLYTHLSIVKGWSREETIAVNQRVIGIAESEGLKFDLANVVVANTYDAHRLCKMAYYKGVQQEVGEKLFRAYFTEGKNIADHNILVEIGINSGLDREEIKSMLSSGDYRMDVDKDMEEAMLLNVKGVPFFVFNRKFVVSGAQPIEVFQEALARAQEE